MNKKTVLIGITIIIVVLAAPYLFFIFTTTMSKPTSFELSLPKDAKIQKVADNNKSISVLIVGNDKLYCYANNDLKSAKEYSLNEEPSFRKYLLEQKEKIDSTQLLLKIKANKNIQYKTVVAVLDEMTINGIKRYALIDTNDEENAFIKSH